VQGNVLDRHADAGLEALLPGQLGGVPLAKYSLTATEFVRPEVRARFDQFLAVLGASEGDVSLAVAIDPSTQLDGSISALRIRDAETGALLQAYLDAEAAQPSPSSTTPVTIGGRAATKATSTTTAGTTTRFIYAAGDVLFIVATSDDELAAQFFEELP
jgi:hypothetical protein